MTTQEILSEYAGARVTQLIGRQAEMRAIREAVAAPPSQSYVFYIEAWGGIGKTFLAREVLRCCEEESWTAAITPLVARREVDLYHHQTHSREGFMAEVVAVLGEKYFPTYCARYDHLQGIKYDLRGAINELKAERDLLIEAFLGDCERLSEDRRLVLALDTAEKIVYESDRLQQALDLRSEAFELLPWLLNAWLPRMKNAVILICGRPRERMVRELDAAAQSHSLRYQHIQLSNFSPQDSLDYFSAVRKTADRDRNEQAGKRLSTLSEDARKTIHLLTGGRPILLALFIDYYLVTGLLLSELQIPWEELVQKSTQELKEVQEKVEEEIVRQFQELDRPANGIIQALAWVPKGADAELLARLAGLDETQTIDILTTLSKLTSSLSFIKIRRIDQHDRPDQSDRQKHSKWRDRRAFLHDEMYALMRKYALGLTPAQAREVREEVILGYYREEIEETRELVAQLSQQKREGISPDGRIVTVSALGQPRDPGALALAMDRLRNLLVEEVYYRLQNNPLDGFEIYCEYAEEAITSNDEELYTQLRNEMLEFEQEIFEDRTEIRGLSRGDIERHAVLSWLWRNLYSSDPWEVYRISQHLREKEQEFLSDGGLLSRADLVICESWAAAFLAPGREELWDKERKLRETIEELNRFSPQPGFEKRRRDVLLAKAHHILGYLLRVQGRFGEACDAYGRALPLWRLLKREVDQAEALNNLAWASSQIGKFGRALRYCEDGLQLREQLGHRYLLALSFNTLGLISIGNDQPHRGRVHSERALAIFRDLGMLRGIGLASIALSEAHRRSTDAPGVYFPDEKFERLQLAEEFARTAVDIFRDDVKEKLRLIEALIELGCVYRNLARLYPEYHAEGLDQEKLIQQSEAALREAVVLATDPFPYLHADALVDLAWLYYYVSRSDQAKEVLNEELTRIVPDKYWIKEGLGVPPEDDRERLYASLWVQLGKVEVLRGLIAREEYDRKPSVKDGVRDEKLWAQVAEHFTLALAYSELFAEDYRGLRTAKNSLYAALRDINEQELPALYAGISYVTTKYNLKRPSSMYKFVQGYFGGERAEG